MAKEVVKLIKVEADANNNKFYTMVDNGDGTWTASWGRVGQSEQKKTYPISQWDKKYREKTSKRKGYKDVTEFSTEVNDTQMLGLSDPSLDEFFASLQSYSTQTVGANYNVEVRDVTQKQVDEAQRILNDLSGLARLDQGKGEINTLLQELFTIIPRKMKRVSDELIQEDVKGKDTLNEFKEIITREQDLLDVMKAEVETNAARNDAGDEVAKMTMLDLLGLRASPVTDEATIGKIKELMGRDSDRFVRAFEVDNVKTREQYNDFMKTVRNDRTELLWHGSRNENWLSILRSGLILRPTNAVITGKMFGYGTYFSPLCRKSIGYTSVSGSYWANGSHKRGYLALYDVHVGIPKEDDDWRSEYSQLNWEKLQKYGSYDSFWAHPGYLRNPEVIVYKEPQSTVRYIIEFE